MIHSKAELRPGRGDVDGRFPPNKGQWQRQQLRPWLLAGCVFLNLLIFGAPDLIRYLHNRGDYTPFSVEYEISTLTYDETQIYAPGPRHVERTGRVSFEVDVYELRQSVNSYPIVHALLLGWPARFVRNLECTWMLAHAVLPTAIWLLLWGMAWQFTGSPVTSLAIAWATIYIPFAPRYFLFIARAARIQPLAISRMPHPALSFVVLLLAVWFIVRAVEERKGTPVTLGGVLAGILFYTYYFYWVALFAGITIWVLLSLWTRQYAQAKKLAQILAIGMVVGLPFLWLTAHAGMRGMQNHLLARIGVYTREPDVWGLVVLLILVGAAWLAGRYFRARGLPAGNLLVGLLCVCAGGALGLNLHMLTGYDAQRGHFYYRLIQPLALFALLLWIGYRSRPRPRTRPLVWMLIAAMLALAMVRQVRVAFNTASFHQKSSPRMDLLLWVREHLPMSAVIGCTDDRLLTLIPAISGNWTFVPLGDRTVASNEEVMRRFLVMSRLEGKGWEAVRARLAEVNERSWKPLSWALFVEHRPSQAMLQEAEAMWEKLDVAGILNERKLDYVILPADRPLDSLGSLYPQRATVYRNREWQLVRLR